MTFQLHIGIDYSGAQTPTSCLAGLQVYAASTGLPERVSTPAAPHERTGRRINKMPAPSLAGSPKWTPVGSWSGTSIRP